jgi:hypothetical protein
MGYEGFEVPANAKIEDAIAATLVDREQIKRVLCIMERAGAYYIAANKGDGTTIEGAVVIVRTDTDGLMYKYLHESAGPIAISCPIEVLRLLSPTDNLDVLDWRERCWTWNSEIVRSVMEGPSVISQRINEEEIPMPKTK